jgi:hypothetical protein
MYTAREVCWFPNTLRETCGVLSINTVSQINSLVAQRLHLTSGRYWFSSDQKTVTDSRNPNWSYVEWKAILAMKLGTLNGSVESEEGAIIMELATAAFPVALETPPTRDIKVRLPASITATVGDKNLTLTWLLHFHDRWLCHVTGTKKLNG